MADAAIFSRFPQRAIEQSIPARFAEQVAKFPDRPAVVTRAESWSYAALDRLTDEMAANLLSLRGQPQGSVALLVDQSADAVFAILATLKAGKHYAPLDPAQPAPRLADQIRSAAPDILVAGNRHLGLASCLAEPHSDVQTVESLQSRPGRQFVNPGVGPDALAYIFFTSGSTGTPKGVVDCHRNVLHNVLRYTNNLEVTPSDRLSLIQSPSFSGTVSSLFTALLNGAAVCPFDVRSEGFEALGAWVNDLEITIYHSVPAIFRAMVSGSRRYPSVRVVRLEGDQALPSDVALYRKSFARESVLAVGLGATETGLSCQHIVPHPSAIDSAAVALGYPTEDVAISILDEEGNELGPGEPGEIAVRSRYLALGYWRQPKLEREVFSADSVDPSLRVYRTGDRGRLRADGCLEFLGRHHDRPRINGQHVELGEIESALLKLSGIRQAVVTVLEQPSGAPMLVAFLVAADGERLAPSVIRGCLSRDLPQTMIPRRFVYLTALPLTDNGKIDRAAIAHFADHPGVPQVDYRPPSDDCEAKLVEIWQQELDAAGVGVADNFFDLGGDSLSAERVCAALERALGFRVPAEMLGLHPTISELATALDGQGRGRDTRTLVAFRSTGSKAPIYFVHDHFGRVSWYGPLARKLGSDQPSFGIRVAADAYPLAEVDTIESLATYYLNSIRAVQPSGPFHLAGLCFGGVVAFEMAQQARAGGEDVRSLVLLGVSPYDFPGVVRWFPALLWRSHVRLSSVRLKLRSALLGLSQRLQQLSVSNDEDAAPIVVNANSSKSPQLKARHARMFSKYSWQPYAGPVDLFLEGDFASRYGPDTESWRRLSTPAPRVHLSPFRIAEMFTERHADALAAELQSTLETGET